MALNTLEIYRPRNETAEERARVYLAQPRPRVGDNGLYEVYAGEEPLANLQKTFEVVGYSVQRSQRRGVENLLVKQQVFEPDLDNLGQERQVTVETLFDRHGLQREVWVRRGDLPTTHAKYTYTRVKAPEGAGKGNKYWALKTIENNVVDSRSQKSLTTEKITFITSAQFEAPRTNYPEHVVFPGGLFLSPKDTPEERNRKIVETLAHVPHQPGMRIIRHEDGSLSLDIAFLSRGVQLLATPTILTVFRYHLTSASEGWRIDTIKRMDGMLGAGSERPQGMDPRAFVTWKYDYDNEGKMTQFIRDASDEPSYSLTEYDRNGEEKSTDIIEK